MRGGRGERGLVGGRVQGGEKGEGVARRVFGEALGMKRGYGGLAKEGVRVKINWGDGWG